MPRLRNALLLVAVALVGCADDTTGSAASDAVAADDPQFVKLRNEAFRIFDSGESQLALRALLKAHELVPDAYGVNDRLGRVYADLKRNPEAIEAFERALAVKPEALDTALALVTILTKLGKREQALALLPALHADPVLMGEALYLEAVLRDQAGERDQALALVARSRGLVPDSAYRALSLHGRYLLQDGDFEGARERFAAAVAGRPDYKEALKGLADSCRLTDRPDEARHWDEVLDLVLGLTDNEFVRTQGTAQDEEVQAQTGQRSDYVRRELDLRKQRLARLTEIHPSWVDGFRRLAEMQLADDEREAACATIERFLVEHADLVPDQEVGRLRQRYCGGGG